MATQASFGEFFKTKRQAQQLTLREFCLKHKLDPGNLSRLERDILQPPQDRALLEQYAAHLQIKPSSADWYTFFDLAAAARGRLPDDLLADAAVVSQLPLVFRTLRGKRLTHKQLDELVKKVRSR